MSKTTSAEHFELMWDDSQIYYRAYCQLPERIDDIYGFDSDKFDLYVSTDGISAADSKSYMGADEETLKECVNAYNDRERDKGKRLKGIFNKFSYENDVSATVGLYFGLAPKEGSTTEVAVPWGLPRSQWGELAMNGVATFTLPGKKINDTKVFDAENYQTIGKYHYLRHCFLDDKKDLHGVAIVIRKKIVDVLAGKRRVIEGCKANRDELQEQINKLLEEGLADFGYRSTSVFLLSESTKTAADPEDSAANEGESQQ